MSEVYCSLCSSMRCADCDDHDCQHDCAAEMVESFLDLIGPNEPVDYFSKSPDRSIHPEARNQVRDELRAKVREWVSSNEG